MPAYFHCIVEVEMRDADSVTQYSLSEVQVSLVGIREDGLIFLAA